MIYGSKQTANSIGEFILFVPILLLLLKRRGGMCLLRGIIEITGEVQYLFYSVSVQCERHISNVDVEVTTCWRNEEGSISIVRLKMPEVQMYEGVLLVEGSERITILSPQDLISAVEGCSTSWQYEARNVQSCVLDVLVTRKGGHMII